MEPSQRQATRLVEQEAAALPSAQILSSGSGMAANGGPQPFTIDVPQRDADDLKGMAWHAAQARPPLVLLSLQLCWGRSSPGHRPLARPAARHRLGAGLQQGGAPGRLQRSRAGTAARA